MFELIGILMKWSIHEKDDKECNKSATWLKFQHKNFLDVEVPAEVGPKVQNMQTFE
jgi:hypothetical protein